MYIQKRSLTDQEKIEICKGYESGQTSTALGLKYDRSSVAILMLLRRRNVPIRSKAGAEARRRFKDGEPITCMDCGVLLTEDNWRTCDRIHHRKYYICVSCVRKKSSIYWAKHKERKRENSRNASRKQGIKPMSENKTCTMYLGVHVAERVLSKVFKNVDRMPHNHPGYDFICNKGMKIDVKSGCKQLRKPRSYVWTFDIKHNTIADYFLCIAFDNREDLNPLHIWLLPGDKFNDKKGIEISKTLMHKWDEYRPPIDKVITCCGAIKYHAT